MLKRAQYWLDNLDEEMVHEIAKVEGIILEMYYDSVGVATWSVGITSASGHNVQRYNGKPSTMKRALEVYIWLLKTRYGPRVVNAFGSKLITKEQFAAALSFDWNTGRIHDATWVKEFKAGQVAQARSSIMNFRRPPEIKARREHERDLFFGGTFSGVKTITQYDVNSRQRPRWGSARRVDVSQEISELLRGIQTPDDAAQDAAAEDRQSTTQRAIEVGSVGVAVQAAEEHVEIVNNVATTVEGWTGWDFTLIVAAIILLALAYVYRERIRKMFVGRKIRELVGLTSEVESMPVSDYTKFARDEETREALAKQVETSRA